MCVYVQNTILVILVLFLHVHSVEYTTCFHFQWQWNKRNDSVSTPYSWHIISLNGSKHNVIFNVNTFSYFSLICRDKESQCLVDTTQHTTLWNAYRCILCNVSWNNEYKVYNMKYELSNVLKFLSEHLCACVFDKHHPPRNSA